MGRITRSTKLEGEVQSLYKFNKNMDRDLLSRSFKLYGDFSDEGNARETVKKAVAPLFLDNFQIENVKILQNKEGKNSILFRVCLADIAADIARKRYKLKNEDYSIFD